jgi:hypothetical protein
MLLVQGNISCVRLYALNDQLFEQRLFFCFMQARQDSLEAESLKTDLAKIYEQ